MKNWTEISPHLLVYDRATPRYTGLVGKSGCYALYGNGRLLYIGSATNLDARIRDHIRTLKMCGPGPSVATMRGRYGPSHVIGSWRIKYRLSRFYGDWATRELRLIRRLSPPMNVIHTGVHTMRLRSA